MSKKIRVYLLGHDLKLLKNISERIAESRPVEVKYYSEIKEFLTKSLADEPDMVGTSINFQHPNAIKFSEAFTKALNIPVIVFGEDQGVETRKKLMTSKAEYKISGVITRHNLWMKIVSFQKSKENKIKAKAKAEKQENKKQETKIQIEVRKKVEKKSIEKILGQDENSIVDSLFEQIEKNNKKTEIKTGEKIKSQPSYAHIHGTAEKTNLSIEKNNKDKSTHHSGVSSKSHTGVIISADEGNKSENSSNKKDVEKLKDERDSVSKKQNNSVKEKPKDKVPEATEEEVFEKVEENTKKKPLVKKASFDKKGRVQLTNKNDIKKRKIQNEKEKKKKEILKIQNLLEACCQKSLKEILASNTLKVPRDFSSKAVSVFIVEVDIFKGFILISENFKQGFEKSTLESIRNAIINNFKSKGYVAELSIPYNITVPKSNYSEVVDEACEFTIYEEENTGRQIALSYLEREVTHPRYEDSDKEGMILVDMQTIPPQTPVNFDAFIHLPRNKKFVRYLKEGRSLSLKQVKRHIEEKVPCKLYLPKNDKGKLIQFFIQNTISWEFISYNSSKKESA